MKAVVAILGLALLAFAGAKTLPKVSYEGHKVLRVEVPDRESFDFIASLPDVHFWKEGTVGGHSDIMVKPNLVHLVETILKAQNFQFSTMVEDVQDLILKEQVPAAGHERVSAEHNMDWTSYHSQEDIYGYLNYLASKYDFVSVEKIGQTFEKRDMMVLKVCRGGCGNKTAMWIDGGIHSREWISPATVTFMIKELVENDSAHPDLTKNLDWYILPINNPDGYAYTRSGDRMWRKTRSDNDNTDCKGCDANRNFGFHWNTGGSSNNPCSDTYHGKSAFSEKETENVRTFIMGEGRNKKIKFWNSIHSYSQLILLPWGFTTDKPSDIDKMESLANESNKALMAVHGKKYGVGCIPCVLYVASGGSLDWAKGTAGIPYSYGMELRDTGAYGFLLPPDQIIPTGEESWAFHMKAAEIIYSEFPNN